MKCLNCGIELSDNVKFCPECGEKVVHECVCQNCGTKLAPNVKFCPECGTKVGEMPLPKADEPAPKQVEITDGMPREELLSAAEAGNSDAMAKLANDLLFEALDNDSDDFSEAAKWYEKAVALGNVHAMVEYATWILDGSDNEKAFALLEKAANLGNAEGQYNLGIYYRNGKGVEQDYDEAFKWFNLSAKQNYSSAQYWLAQCYENGLGCDEDIDEAKHWYKNAAEQGNTDAMIWLGVLYAKRENGSEAFSWYRKAAEKGNVTGQFLLGSCYRDGFGCNENFGEAKRWYKKAADQGDSNAMNDLGNLYYSEENYSEAVGWFKKAAEKDNVKGQYNLGFCYYNGVGVLKNEAKGLELIQAAAEAGDEDAIEDLNNIQKGIKRKELPVITWGNAATVGKRITSTLGGIAAGLGTTLAIKKSIKDLMKK